MNSYIIKITFISLLTSVLLSRTCEQSRKHYHAQMDSNRKKHFVIALDLFDKNVMYNSFAAPLYKWTFEVDHPEVIIED